MQRRCWLWCVGVVWLGCRSVGDRQVAGDHLRLRAEDAALIAIPEDVRGIAFDSHGRLYGWSGTAAFLLGGQAAVISPNLGHTSAEVLAALRQPSDRMVVLHRDDEGIYPEEGARRLPSVPLKGKVRAVAPTTDGWWVLSQFADSLRVSRARVSGGVSAIAEMAGHGIATNDDFHAAIGGTAARTAVAWVDDSLRTTCVDGQGRQQYFTVAVGQLPFPVEPSTRASFTAVSVVPVDQRFLVTVSHDQSRRRVAVLADESCRFLRATTLPDLVVPLASDNARQRLVAADFTRGRVLRVFSWEWANLKP